MRTLMLYCSFIVLLLSACGKDSSDEYAAQQAELDEKVIQSYLTTNALDGRRDASGLYYVILKTGTGAFFNTSSTVNFNYTGKFVDNTTYYQGSVNTVVGNAEIKGWQIGLTKINKGGQIMLLIPSALAYGPQGKGTIPANKVLVHIIDIL
ncbi:FKBP-type peptidyl-prolyl cis-trans isomerase [uncultured Mucilaginibacter sp.]|uniref:FKBP-type peptidyl-prolyl cis-trans isomerase n=1 Tax=uncultured Mucilaginibacter sp. TaxID=797541 RepID=UPI0025DD9188|nr:FKBP-type peptidyl-prolyl cis-trans isomerase [uncultured Mucilaginibacter sp.]